jgi:hypothetical protein
VTRPLLALAAVALIGCGRPATTHPARPRPAVLTVAAAEDDAALWIDERFVAEIGEARHGVRLPPGPHRIEVRHPDRHTYYGELRLGAGERREIVVRLAERLE